MLQTVLLEKLKRSEVPMRSNCWRPGRGCRTCRTPRDGKPGMDGLDLDGDRDYVILPRLYFDGRPPWTLEAIVRPVEIDQSVPANGSPVGWTSLISAADGGAIALDTSRRRWAIELYTAAVPADDWTKNYSVASARNEVVLRRMATRRRRVGWARNCGSISTANCRTRAPASTIAPAFLWRRCFSAPTPTA